jgi:hypothetical protein
MTDQTKEQVRLKNKAIFDSVVEIIHILKIRTAVEHTQALDIAEKTYRSGQITLTSIGAQSGITRAFLALTISRRPNDE